MRFWRRPRRGFASITQPICPTFWLLGQASVPLGRADDSIRFYELALDLDLTDVSTRLNLANQLIFMGRFDQARDNRPWCNGTAAPEMTLSFRSNRV